MLNTPTPINQECQKLIERLERLDFIDPFSQYYFNEIKDIESEIFRLNTRSICNTATKKSLCVGIYTTNNELNLIIQEMMLRYANNTKIADEMETKIFSNIHSYDFKAMNIKIRARVDFLDIYLEITKISNRHDIKKFLTEKTGIRHYIKESLNGYVIRLHDMNSLKLLNERMKCLDHFGLIHKSMKIVELEVALDFYGYKHLGLVTALLKSLRLPSAADNFRIFKAQTGVFTPIPVSPIVLCRKLEEGFNVGINHRLADEYWHIYQKQTDQNGTPLKESEWRIRAEKNIKAPVLTRSNNSFSHIRQLLLECFSGLRFTQLNHVADSRFREEYSNRVQVYGMVKEPCFDSHRNLRRLIPDIGINAGLNRLVVNAVCNLAKNFNHYS